MAKEISSMKVSDIEDNKKVAKLKQMLNHLTGKNVSEKDVKE